MANVPVKISRAVVKREGASASLPGNLESNPPALNPPGLLDSVTEFTGLNDTPATYIGQGNKLVTVKNNETGLEFITDPIVNSVLFDTTPTNLPTSQGTMAWDTDNEAISVILNGYKQIVGANIFYPVKNQTGSSIAKGTAVRFAGTLGNSGRLLIAPFIANGSVQSTFFMGVTAETIANGADGKVLWFGALRGINTNAFNEGDILYASTTTAGGFQTAVPQAPNNIVQIAAVVTKSTNVGSIFIRPTLGSNINKDEGVKITTPATGQLLQLQSNSLWENKTLAQILGGTSSQFVKGDASLDSNTYLTANQTITLSGDVTGSGTTAITTTIANNAVTTAKILDGNVTLSKIANIGANTLLGNQTGSPAPPIALTQAQVRNFLDFTAVGSNLTRLPNPAAIRFIRINADNTVNAISDSDFRTAIGAQAALTNPITGTETRTQDFIPKFGSDTNQIQNSQIFDNATFVGINTTTNPYGVGLLVVNHNETTPRTYFQRGVNLIEIIPSNGTAANIISSSFTASGSSYMPLAISARQNPADLYLTTGGNVGIGTTSPTVLLHLIKALGNDVISIGESGNSKRLSLGQESGFTGNYIDSTNIDLKFKSYFGGGTGGNIIFQTGVGSVTDRLRITSDGTIQFNAYGAGTLSTNASGVISASDGRYKTKTRVIKNALDIILALQPTYFKWNEGSPFASEYEELGFIAQEVAAVIPEASPDQDEEGKFRNYHDRAIIAMLVKGVQELKAQIDILKKQ